MANWPRQPRHELRNIFETTWLHFFSVNFNDGNGTIQQSAIKVRIATRRQRNRQQTSTFQKVGKTREIPPTQKAISRSFKCR